MGWRRHTVVGLTVTALAVGGVVVLDVSGTVDTGLLADAEETADRYPAVTVPATAEPALAPSGDGSPPPDPAAVEEAVLDAVDRQALPTLGVSVVDVDSGQTLLDDNGSQALAPASTAKILTGVAALTSLDPGTTFATRVVSGAEPSEIVLVGGGDPLLTASPVEPDASGYPRGASLASLADATAARLAADGVTEVTLGYDATLFADPSVSPEWEPGYVPSGVVSPVSALTVDQGRVREGSDTRADDPAAHAAETFAAMLEERGVTVAGTPEAAVASPGGEDLAAVQSAPVSALVEHMLDTSDNDTAEVLLRHTALAQGLPATFEGGGQAVSQALTSLGVDTTGLLLYDGSGLSRQNRVPAGLVTEALAVAADDDQPALRPVVTGLPVAGFSGTLDGRFDETASRDAAGTVRAKTGTLTGVASLAGLTTTADGRTVAFAFLANDVTDAGRARRALDRAAAALTDCCR